MIDNKLIKSTYPVTITANNISCINHPDVDYIFSYIVYAKYTEHNLTGFVVEYSISQTDCYNTISMSQAIADITANINKLIAQHNEHYVVSYQQAPIELQLQLFEPYIRKLSNKLYLQWNKYYEFEDLLQICNMTMVILYNKGYYLNDKLLYKSVINYLRMTHRKERLKPHMISLDSTYYGEDEHISIADTIPDVSSMEEQEAKEDLEWLAHISEQKRELIIDIIGQRQYDQLLREYGTKTVSLRGRQQVNKLKVELAKLGITSRSFINDK